MNNKRFIGKRVLLVDDSMLNLNIINKLVSSYRVITDTATGGQELIDKVNSNLKYDLIITDEMMPEISGTKAMKMLKSQPLFSTPIVVLTGDTVDGAKEKYLSEGFDYYLAKPINKEELNIVMNTFIK